MDKAYLVREVKSFLMDEDGVGVIELVLIGLVIVFKKQTDKVSTGLITYAARDSEYDGKRIRKGEIMALENGKIVSTSNDITKATYRLARGMCKKDSSFVTIISGCDVSDEDAEKVTEIVKAKCPNHVEVSHIRGGQPVYYYMISVE